MKIKICEKKEIPALADTANRIWHEYFPFLLTPEQIDYMIEHFQSESALIKAIDDGYVYFLLLDEQQIIGYCGVCLEKDHLFLSKLYLLKAYRGKGYASKLFQKAVEYAKNHQKQSIILTCNKYNTNSLALYKHYGFEIIDSVVTDIGNGFVMDDHILKKNISF